MQELEKKIKDLKEFIKEKTDQGTANYLGKEIREICGMVESEQFSLHGVSHQRELLIAYELRNIEHPNVVDKEVAKKQAQEYLSNL